MNEPINVYSERAGFGYQTKTLENGLTLLAAPMPGYRGMHAVYATNFGSVDRAFSQNGKTVNLPAGVAHFLEHKMFENEEGDAFTLYAQTGAQANAFTGFERTCYVFSATQQVDQSLDILLSFVSRPYFTAGTVEKEQGIIGQEIKMYDDSPDWRMMFALLRCLYHNCPVKEDIAGTVESIRQITPEMLYACTDAFYAPGNMVLAAAGNVTLEQLENACRRQGLRPAAAPAEKLRLPEPDSIVKSFDTFTMALAQPAVGIAFKEKPFPADCRLEGEIICDMLCELICGDITPLFRRLYDEGLIDGDFSGETCSGADWCAILFTGESKDPKAVQKALLEEIDRLKREGIRQEDFELCRNLMYGEAVGDFESVEGAATDLVSCAMRGEGLFDRMQILSSLTRDKVQQALCEMFRPQYSATVIIRPSGVQQ